VRKNIGDFFFGKQFLRFIAVIYFNIVDHNRKDGAK